MNNAPPEYAVWEYDDGPWASTTSDPLPDNDDHWHFPRPDVSAEAKVKASIRIVPLKQGFEVWLERREGYGEDGMGFTDAVDLAEWLGEWLGLGDDPDWRSNDYKSALEVVEAAKAYVLACEGAWDPAMPLPYDRLRQAVKKWCVGGFCLNPGYGELPYPVLSETDEVGEHN